MRSCAVPTPSRSASCPEPGLSPEAGSLSAPTSGLPSPRSPTGADTASRSAGTDCTEAGGSPSDMPGASVHICPGASPAARPVSGSESGNPRSSCRLRCSSSHFLLSSMASRSAVRIVSPICRRICLLHWLTTEPSAITAGMVLKSKIGMKSSCPIYSAGFKPHRLSTV